MGRMTAHIIPYMKWKMKNVWNHQPDSLFFLDKITLDRWSLWLHGIRHRSRTLHGILEQRALQKWRGFLNARSGMAPNNESAGLDTDSEKKTIFQEIFTGYPLVIQHSYGKWPISRCFMIYLSKMVICPSSVKFPKGGSWSGARTHHPCCQACRKTFHLYPFIDIVSICAHEKICEPPFKIYN